MDARQGFHFGRLLLRFSFAQHSRLPSRTDTNRTSDIEHCLEGCFGMLPITTLNPALHPSPNDPPATNTTIVPSRLSRAYMCTVYLLTLHVSAIKSR